MLVVSRKTGERLVIGESVEITVLGVRGEQVSLGISAPREVPIHRQELLERIRRENRRAASLGFEQFLGMTGALRELGRPARPATAETPAGDAAPPATSAAPAAAVDPRETSPR